MHSMGFYEPPRSYKCYKAEKFNKLKDRARGLKNAVSETSLTSEDKKAIVNEMIKILSEF